MKKKLTKHKEKVDKTLKELKKDCNAPDETT
jgi:hypothetical protein